MSSTFTPFVTTLFFFSSRRRHTRLTCDWSSDVCSSDLGQLPVDETGNAGFDCPRPGRIARDEARDGSLDEGSLGGLEEKVSRPIVDMIGPVRRAGGPRQAAPDRVGNSARGQQRHERGKCAAPGQRQSTSHATTGHRNAPSRGIAPVPTSMIAREKGYRREHKLSRGVRTGSMPARYRLPREASPSGGEAISESAALEQRSAEPAIIFLR